MNQYTFMFIGREKGAIGSFHDCRKAVEAPDMDAAKLKLYDTHEHITALECVRVSAIPNEVQS